MSLPTEERRVRLIFELRLRFMWFETELLILSDKCGPRCDKCAVLVTASDGDVAFKKREGVSFLQAHLLEAGRLIDVLVTRLSKTMIKHGFWPTFAFGVLGLAGTLAFVYLFEHMIVTLSEQWSGVVLLFLKLLLGAISLAAVLCFFRRSRRIVEEFQAAHGCSLARSEYSF